MLRVRPNRAKHRWTEHDAGDQLTYDRGLADPLHDLAQEAANQKQQHDLRDEESLDGTI